MMRVCANPFRAAKIAMAARAELRSPRACEGSEAVSIVFGVRIVAAGAAKLERAAAEE
jgi:hypothetical protein